MLGKCANIHGTDKTPAENITENLTISSTSEVSTGKPYTDLVFKNTNHQQMYKESFITNRNTLLHVSTLLGHLQGELFRYRYTKVALYS
jgi:hypothetical protein